MQSLKTCKSPAEMQAEIMAEKGIHASPANPAHCREDKPEARKVADVVNIQDFMPPSQREFVPVDLAAFTPMFETCDTHGDYPLNRLINGVEHWTAGGCPTCKRESQTSALLAKVNIPRRFAGCEFGNFVADTDVQRSALGKCRDYADKFREYHRSGACLMLRGNPGTGKNHLATAIVKQVMAQGFGVLRIKAAEFLDAYWAKSFAERTAWLDGIANVDLLMLDEVGRTSQAKGAEDAFFRLLDARYEAERPTLLLSNLTRDQIKAMLGDAAYDRLTQGGGKVVSFDWDSYRKFA